MTDQSTPSLRRGTAHNLTGQILPAVAALIAIPVIRQHLGDAQLGVLLLAWSIVGYLGIFDLGFRRALTHAVATDRSVARTRATRLLWTTGWTLALLGVGCAGALIAAGPWLVPRMVVPHLNSPADAWIILAFVALSLPFVAVSSALRGAIEGHQRFDLLNRVRTPTSAASYLGPMIASLLSASVVPAVIVLVAVRIVGTFGLVVVALRLQPSLRQPSGLSLAAAREMIDTSGWMTVANVAGSSMLYLDRFIVGALAPLAAVAYYTTPQEMVSKLLVISASTSAAAFPAMASVWAHRRDDLARVYERTHTATVVALFVPAFAIGVLAPDWLTLWIGSAFAANALVVVWWVSLGTFLAGTAAAPLALLQATGRSGLTAAFQLVLLPIYAVLAWTLTRRYGINGAAAAWTIRMAIENALLLTAVRRVLPRPGDLLPLASAALLLASVPYFAGVLVGPAVRVIVVGTVAALAAIVAQRWLGFDIRSLTRPAHAGSPPGRS
jgi:O-antigen/teichoic acid export membrane protein